MKMSRRFWIGLGSIPVAAVALISVSLAQDGPLGTVQQPLVGGTVISPEKQEEFGLLNLSDSCSASLLRNGWAITAAHCVDAKDGMGNTMPDPARPGQNVLRPLAGMKLTANWKTVQERRVVRVETFWPYDVALLQVDAPFAVRDPQLGGRPSTSGYSRLIFRDGQFPYWGEPVGASLLLFGRGIHEFAKNASTPAKGDGQYRIAYARPNKNDGTLYWYPSENGRMIAGGDSGGPSFAWVYGGYALVGVHALATTTRVPGKPTTGWDWVTSTPKAADAPIAPVWDRILAIMGPRPRGESEFSLDSPPPGFIGTFSKTPPNFQPLWLYGLRPNGEMIWYRKDTNAAAWQGPKKVADGWAGYKDVIPAGGNRFYALTTDNRLLWFEHAGFNDGSAAWTRAKNPRTRIAAPGRSFNLSVKGTEIGSGWTFKRIFSGGEGIIYAIRQDGKLYWYRHTGLNDGSRNWMEGREVGSHWNNYRDVFCTGKGAVYVVTHDGRLMLFQHRDYLNGVKSWFPEKQVGTGWGNFKQIIPAGEGVILAVTSTGKLWWYRYLGMAPPSRIRVARPVWEGPVELGSGWDGFGKVIALLPLPTPPPVR